MKARESHLVNSIRVWLNRASSHIENGNSDKANEAISEARKSLGFLEAELNKTMPHVEIP